MKKKAAKKIISLFFVSFVACCVASAFSVINPVEGEWANRQPLVLDLALGEEAYYSLSGSDPYTSGFVYDKPVLLDIDGEVLLRITVVYADGSRKNVVVQYTVDRASLPEDVQAREFVYAISAMPLLPYVAGEQLSVPSTLDYCFGAYPNDWLPGKTLSMNPATVVSRYVPCMVTDKNSVWRFVINTKPYVTGTFTQRVVPFEIDDWTTIKFTDNKYIYRIDDGYWGQPHEPMEIDRSKPHTISWQSVSYTKGNPVQSFVLPAKPNIAVDRERNGTATISASGNGYRLGAIDSAGLVTEMFDAINIDAFDGEHIAGVLSVAVYYNSVYQGQEDVTYNIDKKPPHAPVVVSDSGTSYARKTVNLEISSERGTYVCVAADSQKVGADGSKSVAHFGNEVAYTEMPSSTARISLPPTDSAVFYTINTYAIDNAGNKSPIVTYTVTVDTYNFYVSQFADVSIADGSIDKPYADLLTCLDATANSRLAHIFVDGTIVVPKDVSVEILNDCIIEGIDDKSRIIFAGGDIEVRGVGLTVNNCVITFERGKDNAHFIKLEDALLSVVGSEISGVAASNGVLVDAGTSVISVHDSGLTVSASNYASCVSAVDTDIAVTRSRVAASANTAVTVSMQKGSGTFSSSSFYVTGNVGRVAEFFEANVSLSGNDYVPSLAKTENVSLIFADENSVLADDSKNTVLQK